MDEIKIHEMLESEMRDGIRNGLSRHQSIRFAEVMIEGELSKIIWRWKDCKADEENLELSRQ